MCNTARILGMHQKPNSFAISNWSRHAAECRRKNKNQPSITNFLKESLHNDKVDTVQSDAACVDNCPVEVAEEITPELSTSNTESKQVFWEAPPIAQK